MIILYRYFFASTGLFFRSACTSVRHFKKESFSMTSFLSFDRSSEKKAAQRVFALVLLCCLMLPLFASPLSAAPDGDASSVSLIDAPDVNILSAVSDRIIEDFESRQAGWMYQGAPAALVSLFSDYPYTAYQGDTALSLPLSSADTWHTLSYAFTDGADFSDMTSLAYVLFCPSLPGVTYETRLTLRAASGDYTASSAVTADRYCAAVFDIADFAGRSSITELIIELRCLSDEPIPAMPTLHLDLVTASARDLSACLRFGSDEWFLYGGELTDTGWSLLLDVNANVPFFELYHMNEAMFGDCNALAVKLINRTAATSMTLSYTPYGADGYVAELSYTVMLEPGEQVQYLRFPFYAEGVDQIRFSFPGKLSGQIELLDISPSYVADGIDTYISGDISVCQLSDDRETVFVTGYLSDAVCNLFRGYRLQLFVTPAGTSDEEITANKWRSVAQTAIGSSFSFELSPEQLFEELGTDADTPLSSLFYKQFAVGIMYGNQIMLLDSQRFLSNPSVLSSAEAIPLSDGKKGAVAVDTVLTNTSHATLDVALEKLFTAEYSPLHAEYRTQKGTGVTVNFNEAYVAELDSILSSYAAENIATTLFLTLQRASGSNKANNDRMDRLLIHPEALSYEGDLHFAFNTRSEEALIYLRAAGEFLADRYADPAKPEMATVTAMALGKEIDRRADEKGGYMMGEMILPAFVEDYVIALRVLNAALSTHSACDLAVSFSSALDSRLYAQTKFSFDITTLLPYLREEIIAGGDFDWQLILNPYGSVKGSEVPLLDANSPLAELETLNRSNIASLLPSIAQGGQQVLLIAADPGEEDPEQIADFLYLYYLICQRGYDFVRAVFPACQMDGQLLSLLDTADGAALCAPYLAPLGYSSVEEMTRAEGWNPDAAVSRRLITASLSAAMATDGGTVPLFTHGEKDCGDWQASVNCDTLSYGVSVFNRQSLLQADLHDAAGQYAGVVNTPDAALDLSPLSFIDLSLHLSHLPASVSEAEVTVLLYTGTDQLISRGTVTANTWTDLRVDLSSLGKDARRLDRIKLLISSKDGTPLGTPTLLIGDSKGISFSHTSDQLTGIFTPGDATVSVSRADPALITALACVIGITAVVWVFSILSRLKNVDKSEEND